MPLISFPPVQRHVMKSSALAIALAAGALLAVGCFLGLYVRPTSDDWCGAWKSRDLGVLGITKDFYETQNGRIANAFLTGILYSYGLVGPKVLPTLLVLALAVGLVLLAREIWRALGWQVPLPVVLAAAVVIEMLFFLAGTRSYQVLLWLPGSLSHSVPGILAVWTVVAAAAARRRGPVSRRAAVASAAAVGVVVGTLSEPFTIVAGVFAGAAVLLLLPRLRSPGSRYPLLWSLAACGGLVAGYVLLYTSPGAAWRRAQQPPGDSPLSGAELAGAWHDWLRVWAAVGGQWAYAAAAAAGLLLGMATTTRPRPAAGAPAESGHQRAVRAAALLLLPVLLLMVSSFGVVAGLRMGYGPSGWTYGRAWADFLLPALFLLCGYGVLAGRVLARRFPAAPAMSARPHGLERRLVAAAPGGVRLPAGLAVTGAVVAVFCVAATAALVPALRSMATATVTRSVSWDRQDAAIRGAVAEGATTVAYRPLRIGVLAEPFFTGDRSDDWVAVCVAHYYRTERVRKAAPDGP